MKSTDPRRLKVCHICAALEGATWMVEQLRELRERYGHDVYACVIREDCDFADRLREAGINLRNSALFRFTNRAPEKQTI